MPTAILRNKRMAAEMSGLMREHNTKTFFFAVGVAHVTFSSLKNPNILDHLKAAGFHIERIHPGEIAYYPAWTVGLISVSGGDCNDFI